MADGEHATLAALAGTAERPRAGGWSLRAALTRYAQPQPQRASDLIEVLRRAEAALRPHLRAIEQAGAGDLDLDERVRGVLEVLREVDRAGDVLATWAIDRRGERPDALLDQVTVSAAAALDALGVAREERERPPVNRRTRPAAP